jgi:hypothetical protein
MSKLERRFHNVNTIIIDEVSMVACHHLAMISNRLNTAKHSDPNDPFGGVDIIFFGDFIQFPPIGGSALYRDWNKGSDKFHAPKKEMEIQTLKGMHLWEQVNHVVLLDEQMRVTDKSYQDMLNRLREGKCTDDDIKMLNTRVKQPDVDITSFSRNQIVVPGNVLCMAINDMFAHHHSRNKKVFVSTAKDRFKKKKLPRNLANLIKNRPSTQCQGLPRELPLFVGMPIFLTDNKAVELGLTNGTTGVVRSIHLQNGEVITGDAGFYHLKHTPDYVIVELDDITMKP